MLDRGCDQAEGLRNWQQGRLPRLIAFPLDERGWHAGAWVARLAQTLSCLGFRPLVIDASRGAVSAAMGIRRLPHDVLDLLTGRMQFDDVAYRTTDGVYVVRADEGIEAFVASGGAAAELMEGFTRLSHGFDTLLLAMPTGEMASILEPGDTVPVLMAPMDRDGLTRAYATIKELSTHFGYARFAVAVTGPGGKDEAEAAHQRLAGAANSFLKAAVILVGWIPTRSADRSHAGVALQDMAQMLLDCVATPVTRH